MGHNYSWYHASRHATYSRGDVIKLNGAIYKSADGTPFNQSINASKYFYSYYTNSSWTVKVPVCYGNTKGTSYAYIKPASIVSGGTLDTYTIKYNVNGGIGSISNQTKTYGVDLTLRTTVPTRAGHNFLGWATSSSATIATYQAGGKGGKYTANKAVTLYAVWSPYKHTVAFNANGGSGAPSSQTKKYGSVLKLSSLIPTRDGYDFLGWGTSSTDTSVDYAPGADYGIDRNGGTYTLYAIWKAHTYTIKYNANGGSGAPSNQTKTHDKDLVLSSTKPTRQYYTFAGWGTTSASTTVAYNAGATYTEEKSITLYAIWVLNSYTISYNLDGGTNNSNNKATCVIGTVLTLYTPTKTGYTFVGWHLSSASGDIVTSIPSTNKDNIALYAEWKKNKYKITIKPNGGLYEGVSTNPAIYAYYDTTTELLIPTKEGSEFHGWNKSGAGTLISNTEFKVGAGNCTLTAMWDLENRAINYDTQGGVLGEYNTGYLADETETLSGGSYCTVNYQYGDDISKYNIPSATRENYTFLGWYTQPNGGELIASPYSVTENVTLYAHWEVQRTACVFSGNSFIDGISFVKDNTKTVIPKGITYVFKDGKFVKGGEI